MRLQTLIKIGMTGIGAIALVATILVAGRRPAPLEGASRVWLDAGDRAVVELELVFRDASRPSTAHGEFGGLPHRELASTVWLPATGGNHPLIVSCHGFSAGRHGADYLALALARLGYVVLAPDFPQTSGAAPGGPRLDDVVNQPQDVRFLLDAILAASADPAHPLAGKIDPARIGALGVSLGGLTATLAAFDPERSDERIGAVASLAGPTAMLGPRFFAGRPVPMLLVAGTADAVVAYDDNATPFLERLPGGVLVTLRKGTHVGFGHLSQLFRWLSRPDAPLCWWIGRYLDLGARLPLERLGGVESGFLPDAALRVCEREAATDTMNPIRQQWLVRLAVTSFFEASFQPDPALRRERLDYLLEGLPRENADVTVERARPVAGRR